MRRARVLVTVSGAAVAFGLACNTLTGIEDLERVACVDCEDGGPEGSAREAAATCTCVAAAPPGWSGPVQLVEGAACAPGLTTVFDGGANLGPPGCTPCACSAASAACANPLVQVFFDGQCKNGCGKQTITAQCSSLNACAPSDGVLASASVADAASCVPSGGAVVPATFAKSAVGCAGPTGACPTGQACAPASPACVFASGDIGCPAGAYTAKHVYYGAVSDDHACSTCSCEPLDGGGACTGGSLAIFNDGVCSKQIGTVSVGAGCQTVSGFSSPRGSAKVLTPPSADGGACAPEGGVPSGSASPASPTTFCCAR